MIQPESKKKSKAPFGTKGIFGHIKYIILVLGAVLCFIFALEVAFRSQDKQQNAQPINPPPRSDFYACVAGVGLVEASTENIYIGTPLGGIIQSIFVRTGQEVKAGEPLFCLDDRAYQAQIQVLTAHLALAQADLAKLKAQPRAETLPPLIAQVEANQGSFEDAQLLWNNVASLAGTGAIEDETINRRKIALRIAKARLDEVKHQLHLLQAGAWSYDLILLEAQLRVAQARLNEVQVELERSIIRSPIDGTVLRINIHIGEYANSLSATPLMILGNTHPLHLRVNIDEKDIPLFNTHALAYATARGQSTIHIPLRFVRIEPLVTPKKNLTGDTIEQVDTRVFQVIYALPDPINNIYVGQQMDVFIEDPQPI